MLGHRRPFIIYYQAIAPTGETSLSSSCAVRNHKPGLKYVGAGCVPDLSLTIVQLHEKSTL